MLLTLDLRLKITTPEESKIKTDLKIECPGERFSGVQIAQ